MGNKISKKKLAKLQGKQAQKINQDMLNQIIEQEVKENDQQNNDLQKYDQKINDSKQNISQNLISQNNFDPESVEILKSILSQQDIATQSDEKTGIQSKLENYLQNVSHFQKNQKNQLNQILKKDDANSEKSDQNINDKIILLQSDEELNLDQDNFYNNISKKDKKNSKILETNPNLPTVPQDESIGNIYQNQMNNFFQTQENHKTSLQDVQIAQKKFQNLSDSQNINLLDKQSNENSHKEDNQIVSENLLKPIRNEIIEVHVSNGAKDYNQSIHCLLKYLNNPRFKKFKQDSPDKIPLLIDGDLMIQIDINQILIHLVYLMDDCSLNGTDLQQSEHIQVLLQNIQDKITDLKENRVTQDQIIWNLDSIESMLDKGKYVVGNLSLCDFRQYDYLQMINDKFPDLIDKRDKLFDYISRFEQLMQGQDQEN